MSTTPPLPSTPLISGVSAAGRFVWGLHRPAYTVANLRAQEAPAIRGRLPDGTAVTNADNFPPGDVTVPAADLVYEIPNPFPFRGVTYITHAWAQKTVADPERISIAPRPPLSLHQTIGGPAKVARRTITQLPAALKLALALTSTDPHDLVCLAQLSCAIEHDAAGRPRGLAYEKAAGRRAVIHDHTLFEAVANNPCLPDDYKEVMVLRPGAQGPSAIVGECFSDGTHVYEYLRENSYIPWGHYAANMAHNAIRYDVGRLTVEDIKALRHLYYQRTYVRLAALLGLPDGPRRRSLSTDELEALRRAIMARLPQAARQAPLPFSATLWGWNYGFDYAPNGYRLHASHQQIHQQHALIPAAIEAAAGDRRAVLPAYAYGDLVQTFSRDFRQRTGCGFFECYLQAIRTNQRLDGRRDLPADLVIAQDEWSVLFVPKAQTSQWELQIMTLAPVGNILEADTATRRSLDRALWTAARTLRAMGAALITFIEMSKRFDCPDRDQRLLYSILPRLPESPGAFSENQLRWICGHYPEDFARACRARLVQPAAIQDHSATHP